MNVLTRKIPAYYYDKSNLIRLVLFTAFFDLIFINIQFSDVVSGIGI